MKKGHRVHDAKRIGVKMWSDRETARDCLGYTSYVEVLANVCTHKDLAPLTLGIFGSWGSGKTSLMHMLQNRIERAADSGEIKTKTLWFNAWRYEGREEAQSALIHAILAKLAEDKSILDDTKELFGRLKEGASILKLAKFISKTAMTMTPDLPGLIDCFKDESEKLAKTMEGFDKDFAEVLKRAKVGRIVVFIDDLDRCSSAKVIETFETIKLFLNTPSCTFVIGADSKKISEAVSGVYKLTDEPRQKAKDYLEKIVQIPFSIPEQRLTDISCYIGMLIIGRYLTEEGWAELIKARPEFYATGQSVTEALARWPAEHPALFNGIDEVREELGQVFPYAESVGRGLRGNPRQIKRFLNILSLRRQLANANQLEVKPDVLIKITVLEYVWEDFFESLSDTIDPETGHSELIVAILAAAEDSSRAERSKLVSDAMGVPGLVDYLQLEPKLADTDLSPYLFLAQTSLNRERIATIQPVDEKARNLARFIESDDPIRAKTAAKQAAAAEPALSSAVVRILLSDLSVARDATLAARIVNGLVPICRRAPDNYGNALKALAQATVSGEALAIAAVTLISDGEKKGVNLSGDLKERYLKDSPIAAALAGTGKERRTRRVGG
jgi:hypothetical protein